MCTYVGGAKSFDGSLKVQGSSLVSIGREDTQGSNLVSRGREDTQSSSLVSRGREKYSG